MKEVASVPYDMTLSRRYPYTFSRTWLDDHTYFLFWRAQTLLRFRAHKEASGYKVFTQGGESAAMARKTVQARKKMLEYCVKQVIYPSDKCEQFAYSPRNFEVLAWVSNLSILSSWHSGVCFFSVANMPSSRISPWSKIKYLADVLTHEIKNVQGQDTRYLEWKRHVVTPQPITMYTTWASRKIRFSVS